MNLPTWARTPALWLFMAAALAVLFGPAWAGVPVVLLAVFLARKFPRWRGVLLASLLAFVFLNQSHLPQTLGFMGKTMVFAASGSPLVASRLSGRGIDPTGVPESVREMNRIIEKHRMARVAISPGIAKDPLVIQRLVETSWPVRVDPSSESIFYFKDEGIGKQEVMEAGETVVLVRGPGGRGRP